MSRVRPDLVVIGCAVPVSVVTALDDLVEREGCVNRSDVLRRIMVKYLNDQGVEVAGMEDAIRQIVKNRR